MCTCLASQILLLGNWKSWNSGLGESKDTSLVNKLYKQKWVRTETRIKAKKDNLCPQINHLESLQHCQSYLTERKALHGHIHEGRQLGNCPDHLSCSKTLVKASATAICLCSTKWNPLNSNAVGVKNISFGILWDQYWAILIKSLWLLQRGLYRVTASSCISMNKSCSLPCSESHAG